MIWVNDKTGRFKKRPHYSPEELDFECEKIIKSFLESKYQKFELPITTEDLAILIEQNTEDFDSCCDLMEEGDDVEGITYFGKNKKPTVKISDRLQEKYLENRLRTTLTHEFFHVKFHDLLYQIEEPPSLFNLEQDTSKSENTHKCKRDNILKATAKDWMEWQAGYGCGAFLMPISKLTKIISEFRGKSNLPYENISLDSSDAETLILHISQRFQTSVEATEIRLLQKGFISNNSFQKNISLIQ